MDSNQTAKEDFDMNSLQIQDDDNVPSLCQEAGASIEGVEEELNPLKIGSILEKIFSNLDVGSIKNARQVNPLWSIEGAKMLITKCYLKIPSNLHSEDMSSKKMEKFKAFLSHKSSDHSMIPNIIINKLDDVLSWLSLGVIGQQLESLKLNIDPRCDWLEAFLHLLPNLKHLRFQDSCFFFLTQSAILNVLTSVMSSANKERSPLVISFMYLIIGNGGNELEDVEKFADCNISMEKINFQMDPCRFHHVPDLQVRIYKMMNNLLPKSRNTLKKLTLRNCKLFLPLMEFPRMPALTHLDLTFLSEIADHVHPCKFSPSFRFSEHLPNLRHITINQTESRMLRPSDDFFIHLFEHSGTAPSVKSLEYSDNGADLDIAPLFRTFPNIEDFYTSDIAAFSRKMLQSIWKYGKNLKYLYFKINLEVLDMNLDDLDSIFTGFTSETVDEIKKTPNLDPDTLEEMEKLRVNPSILNLKDLGHLTLNFWGDLPNCVPERFLATAGKYTFALMPEHSKIFIEVGYDWTHRKDAMDALDEVSQLPNVNVVLL